MSILLNIWKQFRVVIIFIVLELTALFITVSFNAYQNSHFFQATTAIRSNLLSSFSLIDDYFNLYSENRRLANENKELAERLKKQDNLVGNTDQAMGQYRYISAKVAYNSIGLPDNYIVLDKGKKEGVTTEMAVISPSGLVGIIYSVSNDYALVMPLINTSFSCLVAVGNSTLSANTSWDTGDYRFIDVKGVPLHLSIEKGDSVFTNKNSTLYPSNELIGTVVSVEKEDLGKSFALRVQLSTDFSKLQNVYIIENKHKPQIDSLLNNE